MESICRRALGDAGDDARSRSPRRDGVALRPRQRAPRAARESGRGRAERPAGQLPQLVLRAAAAALRRGRLRLSGVGPDGRERHRRQDHPPARRRRALRHSLRKAPGPRARARHARGGAPAHRRVGLSRRRVGARALHQARLVRAALGGGDPLRGRADRRAAARGRPVRAARERARSRDSKARPSGRGRARVAPSLRELLPSRRRCGPSPRDEAQRDAPGCRDGSRDRGAGRNGRRRRGRPRRRAGDRHGRPGRGNDATGGEVPRVRLVVAADDAGDPRPGGRRPLRGASYRLGRVARRPARLPRRVLGPRRRRARRRPGAPAGAALRALPHAAGRSPCRAAGDRREGPDRPRVRRPRVLGHGALRPAGPDVHGAGRRPRRAPVAPLDPRPGPRACGAAGAEGGDVPVADDPRPGVLGLLAGRHGRLSHQRQHRRRRRALPGCDGGRGLRARGRPRVARRDRPPLALARPPRPAGPVPHRRRHGARRVQRDRRQQRLHEPARAAEPRRGGGHGLPLPARGGRAGRRPRGGRRVARCRPRRGHPVGRVPRRALPVRGLHEPRGVGLRATPLRTSTR